MKVHNIVEELVINSVNDMFNRLKEMNPQWLSCDCEHCRLDATSYVLNRVPPKYIVSGRGLTYNIADDNIQQKADIESLVMEAIRIVSSVQRPYHDKNKDEDDSFCPGPAFNFPTFFGTVYDGNTFEPISNAEITLKYDGKPASMIDYTWTNPCITDKRSKATFTFLVKPIPAKKTNENKVFTFTLKVEAAGYDKITYNFTLPVISECKPKFSMNSTYSLKIQDLFLFRNN
ncbi:MAG: late competence development ComFB family protein [Treponema sp.]|nr:late competence development ComFB family protein [Treponema sp.]